MFSHGFFLFFLRWTAGFFQDYDMLWSLQNLAMQDSVIMQQISTSLDLLY